MNFADARFTAGTDGVAMRNVHRHLCFDSIRSSIDNSV